MNKDQVKGTVKDIAGRAQEKLGKVTGSQKLQAKGAARQVEGKAQKGVGNVKEGVKDTFKKP
jgi:uncharacterized protein YjbJ (UPF0337 family)